MGKNIIEQYNERALVEYIASLRKQMQQLKYQQAPTIKQTTLNTVEFNWQAFNRATNKDDDSIFKIFATLSGPGSEVLFAIPEFDLYADPLGAGWPDVNDEFYLWPTGGAWTSSGQQPMWYDMDWWYDTFKSDSKNIAATINLRGRSPWSNYGAVFVLRWRFITPGSS